MKKLLLTFLLFSSSISAEVIEVLCKTIEGSYQSGWEYGKTHRASSYFNLHHKSVEVKINTTEKFMIFNQKEHMKVSMDIRGNEFAFNTKIINGKIHIHEIPIDSGTINRETGILSVTNQTKQEGDRGFEFGFSQKFECKKAEYKF
ncbi:hypothetical protein M9B40_05400 [SAR86 cluster bacterium]|uniref:Uncharacterized protein n=1 Tax=SAR86 cluster bacterium TaxID=2030880 RepID=A0A9Q8TY42_9GAMM|nr:hypothetical protein M9B40_05400 [SAR86 cluster bacterium]